MRLDKFLWFVRLAKTRSLARQMVAEGRLRLDGRLCDKPAAEVRAGSVLSFALGGRVRAIRVEALPARRGPAPEALACYADLLPGAAPAGTAAAGDGDDDGDDDGDGDGDGHDESARRGG